MKLLLDQKDGKSAEIFRSNLRKSVRAGAADPTARRGTADYAVAAAAERLLSYTSDISPVNPAGRVYP